MRMRKAGTNVKINCGPFCYNVLTAKSKTLAAYFNHQSTAL